MSPEHARVKQVFALLLSLPASEREAALARECAGDERLAEEVRDLVRHAERANGFLTGCAVVAPELAELPPSALRIPGFTLERVLGRGGMGIVYLACQGTPARAVAIKCLRLDLATPRERRRFEREAEILGRLSHPGIAHVHGSGTTRNEQGEQPWIAMEYVRGAPLLEHAAKLPLRPRIELLAELCRAVEHAHAKGIVHRDLKPSNVLVDEGGRVKVLDFGVARLAGQGGETALRTRTGQLVGTLAYMSPEQARGASEIDARADVHALGLLGFELVGGRLPYTIDEDDVLGAIRTICEEPPQSLRQVRADVPSDLETILGKALAKEPERRYARAGELEADLQRLLANQPIRARRPTALYRVRKFVRRNRAVTIATLAVVASLVTGLGLALGSLRGLRAQNAFTGEVLDAFAGQMIDLTAQLGFGEEQRGALERMLAVVDEQVAHDPTRALRLARAGLLVQLAWLDQARHDTAGMRTHLEPARAECAALAEEDAAEVGPRTLLSRIYAKLGEALRDDGDLAGRDAWFARALAEDERLVAEHPGDFELLEDLGWSLERVAMCACEAGDFARGDPLHVRRLELAEQLVAQQPDHWKTLYELAHAHYFAAAVEDRRGMPDAQLEHLRENVRLSRRLCELQPGRRDFLVWLVNGLRGASYALATRGAWEEVVENAREAQERAEAVYFGDPGRMEHAQLLCWTTRELFRDYRSLGRHAQAADVLERFRSIATRCAQGGSHPHAARLLTEVDGMDQESLPLANVPAPDTR